MLNFLFLSCSAELWPVTSGSWAPWGMALPAETSLVQLTGTSFRWSTRLPWGKTWRRLQIAGASTSSPTNPWRTAISSGKASLEARCRWSTDPACLTRNNHRGQQRQRSSPKEARSQRRPARRRTSRVHPRDVRWTWRAWRKRQRKGRAWRWRGNRQTLQVQTEEVWHVHIPASTCELNFLFVLTDFYQAKRRVVWMPRKSGEWFLMKINPKVLISWMTTGAAKLPGLLRCVRTHTHSFNPVTQQKGLQPHIITLRLIRVLYSLWGGRLVEFWFFLISSGKKGTFEQRRLHIISQIGGFIPIWMMGMPKTSPGVSYCTFHRLNVQKLHTWRTTSPCPETFSSLFAQIHNFSPVLFVISMMETRSLLCFLIILLSPYFTYPDVRLCFDYHAPTGAYLKSFETL